MRAIHVRTFPRLTIIGALLAVAVLLIVITAPANAAVAPSGFAATAGDTQVTLSWNNPNDITITGYRVLWMEPMVKLVYPSHSTNSSVAIQSGDRFGQSVGIDGDRAVVGAPLQESLNNSNVSITDGGWAHAYSSGSSGWSYDEFLAVSDPQEKGRLGESVAIASRTAVVGAPSYYDVTDPGKVIIAAKGGVSNSWAIKFTETGDEDNDYLGTSVAIDDGIAIAGARGIEINNLAEAGKAFVYTRDSDNQDSGVWSEEAALDPGANVGIGNLGNRFGSSVAVDDGTIVVGAWGEDFTRGAAYVFTKNSQGDWTRVARLTASSREIGDAFGSAVAIDGNTIVVGAYNWDGGAQDSPKHGAAFIFTKPVGGWTTATETAKLTASDADDNDAFGFAVAVKDDTIVVGAPVDEDADDDETGSVYLFTKPSGGWATANETFQLTVPNAAASDDFGYSVAARGGRFIVGAPGVASDKGAAYVSSIPRWADIPVPGSNSGTMSHTVTGLTNAVAYTFWVVPVVGGNLGPTSDSVTSTPTAAKAAKPANLTALGIDREVTLSWDDPNDASIERYRYQQKEGDGAFGSWNNMELTDIDSTSEPGKLRYTVSNLTNGVTYTFQIYADDNHEDSDTSAEASATPAPPPPLPFVPPFVSNIGQETDISDGVDADLSRDQAQQFSTGANETGYVLGSIDLYFQRGTDSGDLTVTVWNSNTNADPGSTVHTLTNPDTIEPGLVRFTAPAQLAANTNYFVHVAFSGSGTLPRLRTTTSTNEDAGAAPNWSITNYRHQAESSSLTGWAYQSTLLKISINQVLDPPDAPANLEATVGDGQVVLSWDDPQDDYITSYNISTDGGTNYTSVPINSSDLVHDSVAGTITYVTGLPNGVTYNLAVRAVNSTGNGEASTQSVVMMPADTTRLTVGALDAKVQLSWVDPGNDTIATYQIWRHAQSAKLTAADADEIDALGNSVAVVGDTAVVGAPGDADSSGDFGAVLVFTRDSTGDWSQTANLKASDAAEDDGFGSSVAFDGDTIVVGAPFDDDNGNGSGSAYVFTKSNGDWGNAPPSGDHRVETAKLTAPDGAAEHYFGTSVAVYDGTGTSIVVVGAHGHANTEGAAYVFTEPTAGWGAWDGLPQTGANDEVDKNGLTAKLTADGAGDGDYFGNSVAVDGNTVVVGASGDDGTSETTDFMGSAFVFVKPENGGWVSTTTAAKLTASTRGDDDYFGRSVAIDSDTIVVGADGQDTNTGAAYVFTKPTNSVWADDNQPAKLTASDGADDDYFGYSVAVDDDAVVVGAYGDNGIEVGADSGLAYVFVKPGNDDGWAATNYDGNEAAQLTASNGAQNDKFGTSVAIDGGAVVVGAIANAAYAFDALGTTIDSDSMDLVYADNTIGYTVSGLTNYITYTFKVWAVNPSGVGGAATATATPRPAPPAPQNLQATPGDRQVALSWDDPNDSGITRYQYSTDYMINGGNGNNGVASFNEIPGSNATTSSYTVTGLAHSTTYTLALRAVNPSGNGEASTVTALTLPAKPTGLTGIEYNSQVELGWDESDDSTITKYQLLQITPRKLTAGGVGRDGDFFGMAVAADGDTALVGALQAYDADFNNRPGAAYVFTKNSESGEWIQATLTASDGNDGDEFGQSVALDGDTAVVGAPGADKGEAGEGQVTGTGAAYVFIRDSAGSWTQAAKLTADDAAEDDQFAYSVAVYDDTVVIGAHHDDDDGAESGSAYVFTKPANGGWTSTNTAVKLTSPDAAAGGYYGNSVAVSGDTIVVGAHKADSAYAITKPSSDANDDGSIDWQDWDALDADGKATLTATLTAFDATAGDEFGISVAIDGNTIVVGAHKADSAYAITKPSSDANNDGSIDWEDWDYLDADGKAALTATLTAFDAAAGDEFGISVGVSGDTIVVGAHKDDDKGDESGSAYVFTKPAAGWDTTTETAKIIDHDGAEDDFFGWSVAVDGSTAVVGAYRDGSNKGAAHLMGIPSWADISDSAAGGANATSYTVTGLTNDVMYTFQLRAVASDSHSPASDRLNVTPKAVPYFPTNLSAAGGNGQVALSWDDPEDDTITGYKYSTDGGTTFAEIGGSGATTTTYTVTGLTNGVTHTLALRAVNDLGNGAPSTVSALMVPVAPANLSAAPGDGKVALSWADPGNATITKYQYSTDGGAIFSDFDGGINSATTANTVTDLTNYQEYSFQIRAVNASGEGPASNSASATPRIGKPAKPTGLGAVAGDKQVTLSWTDPDDSTIDVYQISEVVPEDFLTASGGAAGAHFGTSVAIDGDTAVVGADRANSRKGSVYIFTRESTGDWTQQAELEGEVAGDQFGWSVAVEGDTVVVGAHAYDGEDDEGNTLTNSGAVYVFTKPTSSGGWADTIAEPVTLTATTPEAYAFFGGSVDLDGNTLAIGSRLYNAGGYFSAGAAYVFTKSGTTWSQAAKLTASTSLQLAYLGYSLAVDGDTVFVGAYGDDTVFGELGSGSAYVFDKPPGGWTDGNETAKLTASDRQPSGYFGFSVALDGDTAVIGARQHNDPGTGAGSGAAYVFTRESGVWGEKAKLTPSDAAAGDNFGVSVAVEDGTVVVGSWQDDDNGRNSGSAYVFEKPDLGWASTFETLKLTAPNGAANDRFGWSVAVDLDDQRGDLALVGAYSDDIATGMDAGSVHVLGIPDWMDIGLSDHQTTNHTVTSLTNGTEYAYQIRALNRSGAGPASDGASATPLGKPVAPTVLNADAGDGQVTLSWTAATADATIAPITRYEYNTDGGTTFTSIPDSGPSTDNYTVLGLTNLTTYTFAVRAVNVIGEGPSATKDATPASATPAAPDLSATAGDTQVKLEWADPSDSSIDKYQYSTDGGTGFIDIDVEDIDYSVANTIGYTVTSLTNDTEYTFHIRAVDNQALQPYGDASDVTATPAGTLPDSPLNLAAEPGHEEVRLSWEDPNDASIDKYQYSTDGVTGFIDIDVEDIDYSVANTIGYTVTSLTNGTEYTFHIRAENATGVGRASEIDAKPLPPQLVRPALEPPEGGNGEVKLKWAYTHVETKETILRYEVLHLLQTSKLDGVAGDKFGYAVAVDGDIAVIGAYQDDDNGADSGAAYVFTRVEGVWTQAAKLTAFDGEAYDNFGISVGVDGDTNTVVVGAPGDDGAGADSGSVYVFVKPTGGWATSTETAKLTASDGAALDYFGYSVAVDGDTVLVGAYRDDDEENDSEDSGSAYIFTKPNSSGGWADWDPMEDTETAKLTASDGADDDWFGVSVALDGNTAVIGASGDDDKGIDSGSVYVFVKPPGAWADGNETDKRTADDGEAQDNFGYSVAVDVDTVVVGAYQHDPIDPDSPSYLLDAGAAYVFTRDSGGVWDGGEKLTADDGDALDYFGYSVAVDVDTVVVGAYGDDDNGSASGSAYVFTRDSNGEWSQKKKLTDEDGEAGDWFGYSVAVDTAAHTALVGAGSAHVLDIHDWESVPGIEGQLPTEHTVENLFNGRVYDFQVRAVNLRSPGPQAESEAIPQANINPVFENESVTFDVPENTAAGSNVGSVAAYDPNGDDLNYSKSGSGAAYFDIGLNSGAITVGLGTGLDYESGPTSYNFTVYVTDGMDSDGNPDNNVNDDSIAVTINVTKVDEGGGGSGGGPGTNGGPDNNPPAFSDGDSTARTVPENVVVGTEVGGPVGASDPDNDPLEYSLLGTDQGAFAVDLRNGQLTTKTPLDYEVKNEYSVQVRVRDGRGGVDDINVTINVTDVDEPPAPPGAPEVSSAGPTALTVGWTAPDNQGPEITGYDVRHREAGGAFRDAAYSGIGTSMTLQGLRPGASYEVQVRAVNAEGNSPWSESGQGETGEALPTPMPTPVPTATPTRMPTPEPTSTPVPAPTVTLAPSPGSTIAPTVEAGTKPVPLPTSSPGRAGTDAPTRTLGPAATPTPVPTATLVFTLQPDRTSTPVAIGAVTTAPTPTVRPVPPQADSGGDEGFPWWVIVVILIGAIVGLLLFAGARRRRDRAGGRY